jgi:hypothetical protein
MATVEDEKCELPIWNAEKKRWEPIDGKSFLALLLEYAPPEAFPGIPRNTVRMLAALCPAEMVAVTPPNDLRRMLAEVSFEHKASTPWDDDEYWLARSPFDHNFYVFAACPCAGWPSSPVYVLHQRPQWFDEY